MEVGTIRIQKKMTFLENLKKFPGIAAGNFRDRRFPGDPGNSRTALVFNSPNGGVPLGRSP